MKTKSSLRLHCNSVLALAALLVTSLPLAAQDAPSGPYTLPPLPYAPEALEPHIDAETIRIHHGKHHKAYVDNANKLLADQPELAKLSPVELLKNLSEVPESIRAGLRNNVGGHVNHSAFWLMMSPNGGGEPTGDLANAVESTFGSFADFKKQFTDAAMKRFGSDWAWLVVKDGKLSILSTPNQDPPLLDGYTSILGLDVWEHAYYLKYQNRRGDYASAWWNVVNWPYVAELYAKAK
ncbi:MAG: superoxide dismutase [Verrucomicrobia bacterium]|nr:superoxide dismutase [Verrucomicrobiota bacterium]